MSIQQNIISIQQSMMGLETEKVMISFEVPKAGNAKATYIYKKGVTEHFIQALQISPWESVDWRIGIYYHLDGKQDLEIDVSVQYDFEEIEHTAHKIDDEKFEIRYNYKASVIMSKQNAVHFLHDLSKKPEVQDLMFSFDLNGEKLIHDEHPDLFFDFAWFTPISDISLEPV